MEIIGFSWYGLAGCIILLAGVLCSTIKFKGMKHEPFSLWNHFISELGDPRFAPKYKLFAFTLISSGILMIPYVVGVGLLLNSSLAIITMICGLFCAISCILIGIFSEEKVKLHFTVAGCFFLGAALLIILFSITIFLQPNPKFPKTVIIISIIVLLMFSSFIVDTMRLDKEELDRTNEPWNWGDKERPTFWLNPFLEWCAFFAIIGWLFMIVILSF